MSNELALLLSAIYLAGASVTLMATEDFGEALLKAIVWPPYLLHKLGRAASLHLDFRDR